MTRLIDADLLCEEFKKRQQAALRWKENAILDCDEERKIRADATLAFLSEVKLTIDNAPTVEDPNVKLVASVFVAIADQVNAIMEEMEVDNDTRETER